MKIKYTGDEEITIQGHTFKPNKAVDVDDDKGALIAKLLNIPGFEKSRGRPKAKKDDAG